MAAVMAGADDEGRQKADCCPTMGQILAKRSLSPYLCSCFNKELKIIIMKNLQSTIFKNTYCHDCRGMEWQERGFNPNRAILV